MHRDSGCWWTKAMACFFQIPHWRPLPSIRGHLPLAEPILQRGARKNMEFFMIKLYFTTIWPIDWGLQVLRKTSGQDIHWHFWLRLQTIYATISLTSKMVAP